MTFFPFSFTHPTQNSIIKTIKEEKIKNSIIPRHSPTSTHIQRCYNANKRLYIDKIVTSIKKRKKNNKILLLIDSQLTPRRIINVERNQTFVIKFSWPISNIDAYIVVDS